MELRKIESLTFNGNDYLLISINNKPLTWLIYDSQLEILSNDPGISMTAL